jgi:hypothetical protein
MMKKSLVFAIIFSLICAVPAFAAPNYQEGLWEITTTVDMPGMPKEMMRPAKHTTCMTKQNAVPQQKEQGEKKCEMTKQRMEGNKVFWTMTCKDGTVSDGEIAYGKTSFKGSQTMTTSHSGQKMTMKSTMSGKYLGPCAK